MEEKIKVSPDTLFEYLTQHGVKLVRLAEKMKLSGPSLTSCFKHQVINNGVPRQFTPYNIRKLNEALEQTSRELRSYVLTFGSPQTFTNRCKVSYDPALVEPMKRIGNTLNLTALVERVLGWNKAKKDNTLVFAASPNYGHISQSDVDRINAELLSIAGVLSSYEVVAELTLE